MNNNFTKPALTDPEAVDTAAFDYTGWRERFIVVALRVASLLGVFMIISSFPTATLTDRILFLSFYLVLLVVAFVKSPYWLRAGVLLAGSFLVGLNALLSWGVWVDATLFFLAFVAMAGLLFDERVDVFAFVLSLVVILGVAILSTNGLYILTATYVPPTSVWDWVIFTFDFSVLGIVLIATINLSKREFARVAKQMQITFNALLLERSRLEESVGLRTQELEQKTIHLRASTSIARISSQLEDIGELMDTVATLTAERFNLNHAGLFLLDDRKRIAFLQAASSQTGREMIARGYRVDVDKRSAINIVVEQARPYLISNSGESRLGRDVDFPQTRSRLILPLIARGSVIGVMDLHSEQEQVFGSEDTEILQSLADLIAISIENVRLLSDTRALVTQLETLTSYQSQEAWQKYSSRRAPAYQYTPSGVRPLFLSSEKKDAAGLQIPLSLRGQSIGTISLRRKDDAAAWTARERELVEKIASQVALALDNSRLVEEAQKNAQRDQLIANVSNRVRETLDVDSVIRTATLELRRIFDLREAEVSIGSLTVTGPATDSLTGSGSRRAKQN